MWCLTNTTYNVYVSSILGWRPCCLHEFSLINNYTVFVENNTLIVPSGTKAVVQHLLEKSFQIENKKTEIPKNTKIVISVASLYTPCFVMFCVFLYMPFCHGAHKPDRSKLFTTFFLWKAFAFISSRNSSVDEQKDPMWVQCPLMSRVFSCVL